MKREYRPDVLGAMPEICEMPPQDAIARIEKDLFAAAECMRRIRSDYVNGGISESEFNAIEKEFVDRLAQQRQMLQNLRKAAAQKEGE